MSVLFDLHLDANSMEGGKNMRVSETIREFSEESESLEFPLPAFSQLKSEVHLVFSCGFLKDH